MKLKIVVIDDEESIRDSLTWYLEDLGHEVIAAKAPEECSVYQGRHCQQDVPCGHALITDYKLPKMNGLEFIESMLRRGCKGMTSNMLIMSGNATAIDRDKASSLGCQIVQKPLRFDFIDRFLEEVKLRLSDSGCASD